MVTLLWTPAKMSRLAILIEGGAMDYEDEHDNIPGMDEIAAGDLFELLEEAVAEGEIDDESPGHGIALAVLDGKWDNLSAKQKGVFTKFVQPVLERRAQRLAVQRTVNRAPD